MAALEIQGVDVQTIARESAAIYRKWAPLIDAYRGGMPAALVAVRMWIESRGTDDRRVGSDTATGVLSVTEAQEDRFGVPRGTRLTPQGNVFLACLRYNAETALFLMKYPGLSASFADAYVYGGQLMSAIGGGAAGYLFKLALAQGQRNLTYKQFAGWVKSVETSLPETGPWGKTKKGRLRTITETKIVYRVQAMWVAAEAARLSGAPNAATMPTVPPRPPELPSFRVPKDVARALAVDPKTYSFGPPVWGKRALLTGLGGIFSLGFLGIWKLARGRS